MTTDMLGAAVKRTEDPRFITGKGRYLDDIKLPGMTYLSILRSPYAHAKIRSIDTTAAKAMPGVIAVFTGADIPYNPLPMAWPAGGGAGIQNNINTPRVLATDDVKWTGEGVAAVVAETPEQAADALDAIVVDWEPLPTVVDAEKATQPGAPQLHENAPNNVVFEWTVGDKAGTDAAVDAAEVVVRQRIVNQRLIPNPMEVRGDIGWYNPGTDEYTVWMSSQTPHIQRLLLAAFVTGIPEHKMRCITPDVGGAFGTKIFCYADMALVMFASKAIGGRPVKWVEGRRESYQSTIHGRDHITYLEIAGTRDGTVTGLRVKTFANLGGRLSTIGPGIPTTLYGRVLSGCYKIPNVYCEVTGVYTNTTFVDAYRGAGRPEATYVIERAMDLFAAEIGMDRAELRRRNFIPPDQFPYDNPSGPGHGVRRRQDLHRLRQLRAGHGQGAGGRRLQGPRGQEGRGRQARQAAGPRAQHLHRGLRRGAVQVDRRRRRGLGRRHVGVGQHPGPPDRQDRRHRGHLAAGPGPRDHLCAGHLARAGHPHGRHRHPALRHAGHAVRLRLVRVAHVVGGHDGRHQGGRQDPREGQEVRRPHAGGVAGRHRGRRRRLLRQGARRTRRRPSRRSPSRSTSRFDPPEGMEPYLDETAYWDTPNCTWPFGTHMAIVEIDRETGDVDLVRYLAVDDVGKKINPMIVDGQLHGGIAQGVGQALWEEAVYNDDGPAALRLDAGLRHPESRLVPGHRAR